MLEEQLEIVHGLLTEERFSFEGRFYQLDDVRFLPKTVQRPAPADHPRRRGWSADARLVGRWADEFNTVGASPERGSRAFERVRDRLDATAGRDVAHDVDDDVVLRRRDRGRGRDARVERARDASDADAGRSTTSATSCEALHRRSVDQAVERLKAYAAAGVQRILLNHDLFDDLEMLELLADARSCPQVEGDGDVPRAVIEAPAGRWHAAC